MRRRDRVMSRRFRGHCAFSAAAGAGLTLSVLACSIDDRELSVGNTPASNPKAIPLLPDARGFVAGSNAAGITGYWFAQVDSPTCQALGWYSADQCSMMFTPVGALLPSDLETGRMCTSGIAARAINNPVTMAPDFGNIWGAQMGLRFDDGRPYDATAHGITGLSFTLTSPPSGDLRIEFPTMDNPTTAAYWGGSWSYSSPVASGRNVIRWPDVGGPFYLATPPPFDRTKLLQLIIHVATSADRAIPYDFCVSNLAALTD